MYNLWAFVRQSVIKIWLALEGIVFKASGGKYPRSLFCSRANPKHIGSKVRILSENEYSTDIAKVDENGNITDEDFVIVSSTDFHIDTNHDLNYKTIYYFVKHLEKIKPDLVVLTGDIILSKFQQIDAIQFAQMMEKIGVYWTIVFGNHEVREEKGFYKYLMMKSFSDYKHCLAKHGPEDLYGYGNYSVRIHGKNGKLKQALFMFDSGRDIREEYTAQYGLPKDIQGYDFIKKEQIDFYKSETDSLKAKYGDFKSMVYMHIPIKEYELAFKDIGNGVYEPTGECEILYGEMLESVGSSPYNSGLFDAFLEKGSTQAVFSGHDHVNDWCAKYKGIYLVYNQELCYNLYHYGTNTKGIPEKYWNHGVTVTRIKNDGSIEISQSKNGEFMQ